jgi:hypothetical protein
MSPRAMRLSPGQRWLLLRSVPITVPLFNHYLHHVGMEWFVLAAHEQGSLKVLT